MTPRIHGQKWSISHEDREGLYGECDLEARSITLHTSLMNAGKRLRLEILLHEVIHALFPEASEEQVEHSADVLSSVAWSDGWRRRIKPKK